MKDLLMNYDISCKDRIRLVLLFYITTSINMKEDQQIHKILKLTNNEINLINKLTYIGIEIYEKNKKDSHFSFLNKSKTKA